MRGAATTGGRAAVVLGVESSARERVWRSSAGPDDFSLTLSREFENGWELGGFFTLTDVSAEDFGEGSFDKGILLTVPLGWIMGQPSRSNFSTTLRPIQRDGGQRLEVPGRVYDPIRQQHARALTRQWERVWQ